MAHCANAADITYFDPLTAARIDGHQAMENYYRPWVGKIQVARSGGPFVPAGLTVHPLTPERWPDFVRLFGKGGVGGGCWCMGWRLASKRQYLRQKGEANRKAMRSLVRSGTVPGLLAYAGREPIGWCAVAPREAYPALQRSPSRKAVDDVPVWSITCIYVARTHRRQHLSSKLIQAAVAYVRSRGGRIIEGYPVPVKHGVTSTNYAFTGFVSAFEEAGFIEVLRRSKTRPIMRYYTERPHKRLQPTAARGS